MRKLDRFNQPINQIDRATPKNLNKPSQGSLCNPVYASVFSHSINVLNFPDGYYRNGIFSWC